LGIAGIIGHLVWIAGRLAGWWRMVGLMMNLLDEEENGGW